jgi:hypothetical protein
MTEDRHPREHWMLRRKADWTFIFTVLGLVTSMIFYGARMVRAHSEWMDKVTIAASLCPRVDALEKKADATAIQFSMILRELDQIHKAVKR